MLQVGHSTKIQHTTPFDKRGTDKTGSLNQKEKTSQAQSNSSGHETKGHSPQLMQAFRLLIPLLAELLQKLSEHNQPEIQPENNNPQTPPPPPRM